MNTDNRPPPYSMRLDPDLRAKLEAIAKANGRSLHAEISIRLEASLQGEEPVQQSPYITEAEVQALIKQGFKKMYDELVNAKLNPPIGAYPDVDKLLRDAFTKDGK